MLAQITNGVSAAGQLPDPGSYAAVGWVVFALFCIIGGIRQAIGLWGDLKGPGASKTRITNTPLQVQEAPTFVTEANCSNRYQMTADEIAALKRKVEQLEVERREDARAAAISRKGVYDRIDHVRQELSDKIDTMPSQIVTQLLNTKQLWKETL